MVTMAAGSMSPLWGHYVLTIGGSLRTAGIAVGTYYISACILDTPVAIFEDKFPHYRIYIILAWLIYTICWLLYPHIKSPPELYALLILFSLALAMMFPAYRVLYSRSIFKGLEATSWGIWTAIFSTGFGVGALLGSQIVNYNGYKTLFLTMAILSAIAFLFSLFQIKPEKNIVTNALINNVKNHQRLNIFMMVKNIFNRNLALLLLFSLIITIIAGAMTPLWGHYVVTIGGTLKTAGIVIAISCAARALFSASLSFIQDKFPYYRLYMSFSCIILIICWGIYPFVDTPYQLYALIILFSLASGIQAPAFNTLFSSSMTPGHEATSWGISITTGDLATGLGGIIGAEIVHLFSYKMLFFVMGIFSVLALLISLLINQNIQNKLPL